MTLVVWRCRRRRRRRRRRGMATRGGCCGQGPDRSASDFVRFFNCMN